MRALRVLLVGVTDQFEPLIREIGHAPLTVSSSALALHKAATWRPDVLLVDLTRIDGLTLAQHLRASGHDAPLIGIAGTANGYQRQAAIDSGFDEFLATPYRPNELAAVLRRVEARLTESRAIAERSRATAQLTREVKKSREQRD